MSQIIWIVTNFPGDYMNIAGIFSSRMKAEHFVKTHITGYSEISFKHVDPTDKELYDGSSRSPPDNLEDYPLRFMNDRQIHHGEPRK